MTVSEALSIEDRIQAFGENEWRKISHQVEINSDRLLLPGFEKYGIRLSDATQYPLEIKKAKEEFFTHLPTSNQFWEMIQFLRDNQISPEDFMKEILGMEPNSHYLVLGTKLWVTLGLLRKPDVVIKPDGVLGLSINRVFTSPMNRTGQSGLVTQITDKTLVRVRLQGNHS